MGRRGERRGRGIVMVDACVVVKEGGISEWRDRMHRPSFPSSSLVTHVDVASCGGCIKTEGQWTSHKQFVHVSETKKE